VHAAEKTICHCDTANIVTLIEGSVENKTYGLSNMYIAETTYVGSSHISQVVKTAVVETGKG